MARSQEVSVPSSDGRLVRAHLARPESDGDGARPGVLVLHEILGLNDEIRRVADRFADAGYVALAPDLFQGRGPVPICIVRVMRAISLGEGPVVEDMRAARDWLAEREGVDRQRIGVAGFCMGGGFALLLASRGGFRVAAPFYGDVAEEAESYRGICPVVAGFGARDRIFGEKKAALLRSHLEQLGVPHDIVVYPEAGHSYMTRQSRWQMAIAPYTPLHARHHEPSAEDSWRRMLAFFREHLDAPTS